MSVVIIQTAEDLKNYYLQTDITNISSVQSAISELSTGTCVAGKEKYIAALNAASPVNIKKAQRYGYLSGSSLLKNIGWLLMAVFTVLMAVVDSDFEDTITTWLSLGFWVGVGVQVYISTLKNAWNMLTLNGAVVHPALRRSISGRP